MAWRLWSCCIATYICVHVCILSSAYHGIIISFLRPCTYIYFILNYPMLADEILFIMLRMTSLPPTWWFSDVVRTTSGIRPIFGTPGIIKFHIIFTHRAPRKIHFLLSASYYSSSTDTQATYRGDLLHSSIIFSIFKTSIVLPSSSVNSTAQNGLPTSTSQYHWWVRNFSQLGSEK